MPAIRFTSAEDEPGLYMIHQCSSGYGEEFKLGDIILIHPHKNVSTRSSYIKNISPCFNFRTGKIYMDDYGFSRRESITLKKVCNFKLQVSGDILPEEYEIEKREMVTIRETVKEEARKTQLSLDSFCLK